MGTQVGCRERAHQIRPDITEKACRELEVLRAATEEVATGMDKLERVVSEVARLKTLAEQIFTPELRESGNALLRTRTDIMSDAEIRISALFDTMAKKAAEYDPILTGLMGETSEATFISLLSDVADQLLTLNCPIEESSGILGSELNCRAEAACHVTMALRHSTNLMSKLRSAAESRVANLGWVNSQVVFTRMMSQHGDREHQ